MRPQTQKMRIQNEFNEKFDRIVALIRMLLFYDDNFINGNLAHCCGGWKTTGISKPVACQVNIGKFLNIGRNNYPWVNYLGNKTHICSHMAMIS